MERSETAEGIILKTNRYMKDRMEIILFTQKTGLITLATNYKNSDIPIAFLAPFSQIEATYQQLYSNRTPFLKEVHLIADHYFLREKWSYLETAANMGSLIIKSQMPAAAAPLLYPLLVASIKQLPRFQESSSLLLIFYVKFLIHEGLLSREISANISTEEWSIIEEISKERSFQPFQKRKGLSPIVYHLANAINQIL